MTALADIIRFPVPRAACPTTARPAGPLTEPAPSVPAPHHGEKGAAPSPARGRIDFGHGHLQALIQRDIDRAETRDRLTREFHASADDEPVRPRGVALFEPVPEAEPEETDPPITGAEIALLYGKGIVGVIILAGLVWWLTDYWNADIAARLDSLEVVQ